MEGKKEETAPVVNAFYWNRAKAQKRNFRCLCDTKIFFILFSVNKKLRGILDTKT